MTDFLDDLGDDMNVLGQDMRRNSERWYPNWHAPDAPIPLDVAYALGLAGEAGEVADAIKKTYRDGNTPERAEQVALELADAFTYLVVLANERGVDLIDAYRRKTEILEKRHEARRELAEAKGQPA